MTTTCPVLLFWNNNRELILIKTTRRVSDLEYKHFRISPSIKCLSKIYFNVPQDLCMCNCACDLWWGTDRRKLPKQTEGKSEFIDLFDNVSSIREILKTNLFFRSEKLKSVCWNFWSSVTVYYNLQQPQVTLTHWHNYCSSNSKNRNFFTKPPQLRNCWHISISQALMTSHDGLRRRDSMNSSILWLWSPLIAVVTWVYAVRRLWVCNVADSLLLLFFFINDR